MSHHLDEAARHFHEFPIPGKIQVAPTKPLATQHDLALAYSPGVAVPCMDIHANPVDSYRYTARGNLVAVVSNGTAVLGLGNIGPEASKPVMEGKGVLFKKFANIDVFDIEIKETGLRPVEKLYEELLIKDERLIKTDNKKIFIEKDKPVSPRELNEKLTLLYNAINLNSNHMAKGALREAVPTFVDPSEINEEHKD